MPYQLIRTPRFTRKMNAEPSSLSVIPPRPRGAAEFLAAKDPVLYQSLEGMMFPKRAVLGRERRATARVKAQVMCEVKGQGRRRFLVTEDVSTFGLSTRGGAKRVPVGTWMEVVLHLPDATWPLAFRGEVVGTNDAVEGLRVAFRNPSRLAARRLHRFLFGNSPLTPT